MVDPMVRLRMAVLDTMARDKLTPVQLAQKLGFSPITINKFIRATTKNIKWKTIHKLIDYAGVKLVEVIKQDVQEK